jgi:hypothetical protein
MEICGMPNGNHEKQVNGNSNRPPALQTNRRRSAPHPRYSLQQAEKLAKAAFDIGPRNRDQDKVAQKAGYKNSNNGSYSTLRATANQFGLITFEGALLSVSEEWIEVFSGDDPIAYRSARQAAMRRPDLYKQLLEDYNNRQLPAVERLAQQLHINQKYGILKDASVVAAEVFYESAAYAEMLNEKGYIKPFNDDANAVSEMKDINKKETSGGSNREYKAESSIVQEPNVHNGLVQPNLQVASLAGLHKFEIPLSNGGMAYIFAPARLPLGEKERLKKFIDLMLDEPPTEQHRDDRPNNEFVPDTVPGPSL